MVGVAVDSDIETDDGEIATNLERKVGGKEDGQLVQHLCVR